MIVKKVLILTYLGKFISWFSRALNLGHGSTWPGHLALKFFPDILSFYSQQLNKGLILVGGTNGKTTTVKMIRTVLEKKGFSVIHNESGANLLNGLVSAFLISSSLGGKIKADYAIFEVDEATLPKTIFKCNKKLIIVLLNLFRDQLDRYGEVDTIARKWKEALHALSESTVIILNADDPQIAQLGSTTKAKVLYFGIDDNSKFLEKKEHATDSVYCPSCGYKLNYQGVYYSHIGVWFCSKCGITRPQPNLSRWQQPVPGLYNLYNTLAGVLTCQSIGILDEEIEDALVGFQPAFGRQEEFKVDGKTVKVFLAKNPVGVNEAIRTIIENRNKKKLTILLALNDEIPDGKDVSWIWDVEYEELVPKCKTIICTGLRVYDLGLRIKYANESSICFATQNLLKQTNSQFSNKFQVEPDLKKAIREGLGQIKTGETLYILPTYSAMLEVRKFLGGRKIL